MFGAFLGGLQATGVYLPRAKGDVEGCFHHTRGGLGLDLRPAEGVQMRPTQIAIERAAGRSLD
jgi:hypothetical protein